MSRQRKIRITIYLILGLLALYFVSNQFKKPQVNNPKPQQQTSLKATVESALAGAQGTYGIVIKNLKTGESYNLNEHQEFEPGSLYKIWIMATAFGQIQSGLLKPDEILSDDVESLNGKFGISPDAAELTEGEITFSVNDALKQMITISHNYAALLLTERIKLSNVALFLKQNNFNESKVGTDGSDPITTPSDIALFFEKLYKGDLANPQYTNQMLDLLKMQQLNDKLPKALPPGTIIAHKTGEIDYFTHDAGIVYSKSGDYIIVILSQSDSPIGAEDRIAQISKAVYDYFVGYNTKQK